MTTAAAAVLAEIRTRFTESLDGRLAELETLFLMLEDCEDPRRVLKEIGLRAHRIAGVAATLGYHGLGQAASSVDQMVAEAIAHPEEKTLIPAMREIEILLDEMDSITETAAG